MTAAERLVTWTSDQRALPDVPCVECDSPATELLLVVQSPLGESGRLPVGRCLGCGTLFFPSLAEPSELGGYDPGYVEDDHVMKHYVEIGAGIGSMIAPLTRIPGFQNRSLLDVGCGFGFLVNLCQRMFRQSSYGIEMASYGYWGERLLGLNLGHTFLSQDERLTSRKFDVVFSSEVVEHVPDPRQFVRELKGCLTNDGVLVLTTPAAEFITPDVPDVAVLGLLGPGAHRRLFSALALRRVLTAVGFSHLAIEQRHDHLVAWASMKDLALSSSEDDDRIAIAYYRVLAGHEHPWVAGGGAYRLLRELINRGERGEATTVAARLREIVIDAYGMDLFHPDDVADRVASVEDAVDLVTRFPAYLGPSLHHLGMLELFNGSNPLRASRFLLAAWAVCSHAVRLWPLAASEAGTVLASCHFHGIFALARAVSDFGVQLGTVSPDVAWGLDAYRSRYGSEIAPALTSLSRYLSEFSGLPERGPAA